MKCCILGLYILGQLPVDIIINISIFAFNVLSGSCMFLDNISGPYLLHILAISAPTMWAELFCNSSTRCIP